MEKQLVLFFAAWSLSSLLPAHQAESRKTAKKFSMKKDRVIILLMQAIPILIGTANQAVQAVKINRSVACAVIAVTTTVAIGAMIITGI